MSSISRRTGLTAALSSVAALAVDAVKPGPAFAEQSHVFDTVVYGNTWAAVNAACASAQQGAKTALISPYPHIGGCIANGLSWIDFGTYGTHGIGYMTKEFFTRNAALVGSSKLLYTTSPSLAETVFNDMLKYYGVYVYTSHPITSVQKSGATITALSCSSAPFVATNYIDGTEEGDLAAAAGVTMVYGRESYTYFDTSKPVGGLLADPPVGSRWTVAKEMLGGYFPDTSTFRKADCYGAVNSTLRYGYSPDPGLTRGAADLGITAYSFRLCLTQDVTNKRPWPKPELYSPTLIQHLIDAIPSNQTGWKPFNPGQVLDGKYDMNGDFGIPTQWDWPRSNPAERLTIKQRIFNEQASWLWFLANDSSIIPEVQDYVNSFGLCLDEFTDTASTPDSVTPGWSYEVYVRKARRMYGQYIMTQVDLQHPAFAKKTDVIACGFYSLDEHTVQRVATTVNGKAGFMLDALGNTAADERTVQVAYQIPFRAVLPVESQCTNLMVPVAASMSSVAAASMRIDIHKANAGSACGIAAATSAATVTPLNSLNVTNLQNTLLGYGQVLSYTPA